MDKLKAWIMANKALSAGIAIALGLLLYLLLFSRSQPAAQQGASSNDALSAYYGAQAAAQQAGAATNESTNALAAATGQVNAARDVELAKVQGTLASQINQMNLVAYQDWLAENRNTGPVSKIAAGTNANFWQGTGTSLLWNAERGEASVIADPTTGARYYGESAWSLLPTNFHTGASAVHWSGVGGVAPVAATPNPTQGPFIAPFTVPTVR